MTTQSKDNEALRRVIIEVAMMSEDDLALLADFVSNLKSQRAAQMSTAEIRAKAMQRANELRLLPREARRIYLHEALQNIYDAANAKDVTVDGEWQGD